MLVEAGAYVNQTDPQGRTTLHYVNDVQTARKLISLGANQAALDVNQQKPHQFICCQSPRTNELVYTATYLRIIGEQQSGK